MDNQTPNTMPSNVSSGATRKSGIGSIIATIIIIALIVIGALYFWGKRAQNQQANQAAYDSSKTTDMSESAAAEESAQIENVSSDDSVSTLQAENQNTNTANLSQGL